MDGSSSVVNVRHLQPMALLRDLVEENGRVKAAKMLGVCYWTLALAADTGTLTGRMADALTRHLSSDVRSPLNESNERVAELEKRIAALEGKLTYAAEAVRSAIKELRSDVGDGYESLDRRFVDCLDPQNA